MDRAESCRGDRDNRGQMNFYIRYPTLLHTWFRKLRREAFALHTNFAQCTACIGSVTSRVTDVWYLGRRVSFAASVAFLSLNPEWLEVASHCTHKTKCAPFCQKCQKEHSVEKNYTMIQCTMYILQGERELNLASPQIAQCQRTLKTRATSELF